MKDFVQWLAWLAPEGETALLVRQKKGRKGWVYLPELPAAYDGVGAWYGNTGSFIVERLEARMSASRDNIERVLVLMLDDIGTKSKTPPIEPTWKIETMPGWSRRAAASASLRNRARSAGLARSRRRSIFRATVRPRLCCVAR